MKNVLKRLSLLALGLGAIFWLVHETGIDDVKDSLLLAGPIIPVLLLLEAVRIACEALATYLLVAHMGVRVPLLPLFRSSLVSYAVCITVPAGRTIGEALRGAVLTPYTGAGRAATVAVVNQVLTLVSNGTMVILAAIVAGSRSGWSLLTVFLLGYGSVTFIIAVGIQAITRMSRLRRLLLRILPKQKETIDGFQSFSRDCDYFPILPTFAMIGSKIAQALQFGALGYMLGLGFGLGSSLLGQGINLLGVAAGDLIPGQLGTTDGAFALFAAELGTTAAVALTIAMIIHCVQLFWVAVSALIPLFLDSTDASKNKPEKRPRMLIAEPITTVMDVEVDG